MLGQLDVVAGVLGLAGAAIGAGANVGSAFIVADAQRSIAKSQLHGELARLAAQDHAAAVAAEAAVEMQRVQSQQAVQQTAQLSSAAAPVVGGLLVLGFAWLLLRD